MLACHGWIQSEILDAYSGIIFCWTIHTLVFVQSLQLGKQEEGKGQPSGIDLRACTPPEKRIRVKQWEDKSNSVRQRGYFGG
jgi:hypothetical protein